MSISYKDHCKAVKDIIKAGINTFASKGTCEALSIDGHRLNVVETRKQFKVGTYTILPFSTEHDAVDPLGYLIQSNETGEKLLYATDTYYIRYRFPGLNYIMVECNYSEDILEENVESGKVHPALERRIKKSHFSLQHVKEFLKANDLSKVKEIYLIHLSKDNSDADRFKREIQKLTGRQIIIPYK